MTPIKDKSGLKRFAVALTAVSFVSATALSACRQQAVEELAANQVLPSTDMPRQFVHPCLKVRPNEELKSPTMSRANIKLLCHMMPEYLKSGISMSEWEKSFESVENAAALNLSTIVKGKKKTEILEGFGRPIYDGRLPKCLTQQKESEQNVVICYFVGVSCVLLVLTLEKGQCTDSKVFDFDKSYEFSIWNAEEMKKASKCKTFEDITTMFGNPDEVIGAKPGHKPESALKDFNSRYYVGKFCAVELGFKNARCVDSKSYLLAY